MTCPNFTPVRTSIHRAMVAAGTPRCLARNALALLDAATGATERAVLSGNLFDRGAAEAAFRAFAGDLCTGTDVSVEYAEEFIESHQLGPVAAAMLVDELWTMAATLEPLNDADELALILDAPSKPLTLGDELAELLNEGERMAA